MVRDLYGDYAAITYAYRYNEQIKFSLLAISDDGKELKIIPHFNDSQGLSIEGEPLEIDMGWDVGDNKSVRQMFAEYFNGLFRAAIKAYDSPVGDKEAEIKRALSGLHGKKSQQIVGLQADAAA